MIETLEKPDIYADRMGRISSDDRFKLRDLLRSPLYVAFLRVVACAKPSVNCEPTMPSSGKFDEHSAARSAVRLAEIRGWEAYEAAIFLALQDPPAPKQAVAESFPDAANLDLEPSLPPQYEAPPPQPSLIRKRPAKK